MKVKAPPPGAEAKAKEAQAQRLRDEAAAKPSVPAAPNSHRGVWGERTLQAFRQAHRPLVFRVLSFTGRQQAEAHRQEAFNALPALERGAGITISSFDQCFERINRGGKAELLHGLGPTAGQQPGAHYLLDDNRDIVREFRRTGCKAILVQKAGRYYEESDLIDAIRALSESPANGT